MKYNANSVKLNGKTYIHTDVFKHPVKDGKTGYMASHQVGHFSIFCYSNRKVSRYVSKAELGIDHQSSCSLIRFVVLFCFVLCMRLPKGNYPYNSIHNQISEPSLVHNAYPYF